MLYEEIIIKYRDMNKRKEAAFVQKYYIENKSCDQITEELYFNNRRTVYKLKYKVRRDISNWIISNKKEDVL